MPISPENRYRETLRGITATRGPLDGVLDLRAAGSGNLELLEAAAEPPESLLAVDTCLSLLQALLREQIHPARGVWLATTGGQGGAGLSVSVEGRAIQALRRTAALEFHELQIRSLDLGPKAGASEIVRALGMVDVEETVLSEGRFLAPLLKEESATVKVANTEIATAQSGLIEDLQSISVPRRAPLADEVEIAVAAHGINFRDVMNALGMLPVHGSAVGWRMCRHGRVRGQTKWVFPR